MFKKTNKTYTFSPYVRSIDISDCSSLKTSV